MSLQYKHSKKHKNPNLYCQSIPLLTKIIKRIPEERAQDKITLTQALSVLKRMNTDSLNRKTTNKKESKQPKLMFGFNTVSK